MTPPETKAISFWVSGLASPFVTFGERVAVLVEAQQSGDDAMVQQAINAGFGELYSPGGGEVPEWMEIKEKSRAATYARGEVPADVLYLTLAADVQRHSIPWVIRGWGARATSWLINYGYLRGDTTEEEIWNALGDLVAQPIDGLPIRLAFIDSGFRPGKTDTLPLNRVYEFCRRFMRRVRPTKGSSAPMRTPLIMSQDRGQSQRWPRRASTGWTWCGWTPIIGKAGCMSVCGGRLITSAAGMSSVVSMTITAIRS